MTGSIHQYNRQHSSTAANSSNMGKIQQSKFRRWSSADHQNSIETILDENHDREPSFSKWEPTISDDDSGTEEIEQRFEKTVTTTPDVNEDYSKISAISGVVDEGFSECENPEKSNVFDVNDDLQLAETIPDEMKKDFCPSTIEAFHAEFARLLSVPLYIYHKVQYYFFTEEEITDLTLFPFHYCKVDNAKAQFKCPNKKCQHAWTSMRARITFSYGGQQCNIVALKILGQNCQQCGTYTDALWYIDEVCRVMKNLARTIFETYYPDMINIVDLENQTSVQQNIKPSRSSRHDPTQRRGKMSAPHVAQFCEACRRGLCFA